MEIGKTKLALTASALAMALMLAGCGGSSSSGGVSSAGGGGSGTTPTVTPEPDTPEPTSGEQANTLFSQANDAETAAEDAGEMATEALATAKKMAGMLDVISVAGNSKTAMDNAQAILDAETDVGTALANAQKALADAMAAQTAANDLPADTPKLASLKTEIGEAIKAANDAIDAIEAIQKATGSTALAGYVYVVKGSGGKGTPTKIGEGIAKMIGPALGPKNPDTASYDGSPLRGGPNTSDTPPTKAVATILTAPGVTNARAGETPRVLKDDASDMAMTWAEIVKAGGRTVAGKAFAGNEADVDVTSVAGMALTKFTDSSDDPLTLSITSNTQTGVKYMGIDGTLYCVGDDSACTVEDGKLKGKLYFGATDVDQLYTKAPNADIYKDYDLYATYGYWLSQATDGLVTVNTFAGQSDDRATVAATGVIGIHATLASKATYTGSAIGMSMMKSYDSVTGEAMGHKSGEFTAMVTLEAEFNNNPILRGKIDQFAGVGASSDWSVTLVETAFADGNVTTGGVAEGSGTTERATDGVWTAQAYGEADKRPTGIFGGFNAHFDNGHAAGAYATRMKQ